MWGNLLVQFTSAQVERWPSGSSCSPLMLVRAAANTGPSGPAGVVAGVPSTGGYPELAALSRPTCRRVFPRKHRNRNSNYLLMYILMPIYLYLCRNIHATYIRIKILWSQTQNGATYLTHLLLSFPQAQSLGGCCWI